MVYASQRQCAQALQNYQQALVIRREVGDRAGEGDTLNNIGSVYRNQRQYAQALSNYQQALVIAQEIGLRALEEIVLTNIKNMPDS